MIPYSSMVHGCPELALVARKKLTLGSIRWVSDRYQALILSVQE